MSSPVYFDNEVKDILILDEGPTQELDDTTLTVKKKYPFNFTQPRKSFSLNLHYNRANSYLFVNGTEIHKFNTKDFEIVTYPLCLGNISKDFSVDNIKQTGLNGYVYDFSFDYNIITVDDILDIQNYLQKKNGILQNSWIY